MVPDLLPLPVQGVHEKEWRVPEKKEELICECGHRDTLHYADGHCRVTTCACRNLNENFSENMKRLWGGKKREAR